MCTNCNNTELPSVINTETIIETNQGVVFQGVYSLSTQYAKNDLVYYLGSTYIATSIPTIGVLPTAVPWMLFAKGGDAGAQGQIGETGGVTFKYVFSNSNSSSDPGSGYIKADNIDPEAVSIFYTSSVDASGGDLTDLYALVGGGTALIKLFDANNSDYYLLYTIATVTVQATPYYELAVTYLGGTIESPLFFPNNYTIMISFGVIPAV